MTFDFINYMRNIAKTLKELLHTDSDKHFHRISSIAALEEFLANSRQNTGYHLIVLDKLSGRLDDTSNSDNLLDRRNYTFFIFKNVPHGDFDAHEKAIKDCITVVKKVESKMFKDKRENTNGLRNLNRSFYYDTIGPVAHNYYGVMVNFTVLDAAGIVYNEDDWT